MQRTFPRIASQLRAGTGSLDGGVMMSIFAAVQPSSTPASNTAEARRSRSGSTAVLQARVIHILCIAGESSSRRVGDGARVMERDPRQRHD